MLNLISELSSKRGINLNIETVCEEHAGIWWGCVREGEHLEDLSVDLRIILKRTSRRGVGKQGLH
jgi:hypothetical protein